MNSHVYYFYSPMTSRITLFSNPRLIIPCLISIILPVAGIFGCFIVSDIIVRIVILLITLYLSYCVLKFVIKHLRSKIVFDEQGVHVHFSRNNVITYGWDEITHAGLCKTSQRGIRKLETGKDVLFLYNLQDDKFVSIPREFTHFDVMIETIQAKTNFQEIELNPGETLEDRLKKICGFDKGSRPEL